MRPGLCLVDTVCGKVCTVQIRAGSSASRRQRTIYTCSRTEINICKDARKCSNTIITNRCVCSPVGGEVEESEREWREREREGERESGREWIEGERGPEIFDWTVRRSNVWELPEKHSEPDKLLVTALQLYVFLSFERKTSNDSPIRPRSDRHQGRSFLVQPSNGKKLELSSGLERQTVADAGSFEHFEEHQTCYWTCYQMLPMGRLQSNSFKWLESDLIWRHGFNKEISLDDKYRRPQWR